MEITDHTMKSILSTAILLMVTLASSTILANPAKPLLMPDKEALYQRILTVPGATLETDAGKRSGDPIQPFSAFYVYQRLQQSGNDWLMIGTDRHGGVSGWVNATDTLEWSQGLTVAFRDPVGHDRSLLFGNREDLRELAGQDGLKTYKQLYQAAVENSLPPGSPVVAIQPAGHIDIQKNFYLVPIRDHEDIYLGNEQARMLQIASVPLNAPAKQENLEICQKSNPMLVEGCYKVGCQLQLQINKVFLSIFSSS